MNKDLIKLAFALGYKQAQGQTVNDLMSAPVSRGPMSVPESIVEGVRRVGDAGKAWGRGVAGEGRAAVAGARDIWRNRGSLSGIYDAAKGAYRGYTKARNDLGKGVRDALVGDSPEAHSREIARRFPDIRKRIADHISKTETMPDAKNPARFLSRYNPASGGLWSTKPLVAGTRKLPADELFSKFEKHIGSSDNVLGDPDDLAKRIREAGVKM